MREVTAAALQMRCSDSVEENIAKADRMVRAAHAAGAQIVLPQELFERPYFCKRHDAAYLAWATPLEDNPAVTHFRGVAAELGIVIPVSFFERRNNAHYNSIAIIDADGQVLGIYRKTHIPDGPGYSEKFYFNPGDTGFQVWDTRHGRLGIAICWDQWFPETARSMALMGAELLFFPSAIGNEPQDPSIDSCAHWQNTQCGHAAANIMPLIACNRTGTETDGDVEGRYYGSSFIANEEGTKVSELGRDEEGHVIATFDLDAIGRKRREWGVYRDRRPEMYDVLLTKDGETL